LHSLIRVSMPLLGVFIFSANLLAAVPFAERNALLAFYGGTIGANWTDNTGWLTGDPCEDNWFGLVCNNDDTHVITIFLPNNNLSGNITTEIHNLTEVTFISMDGNAIEGGIPSQIGALTQLVELNLSNNMLTSAIPQEVTSLPALQHLYLNDNNLGALLPTVWSPSITILRLHNNILQSELPVGMSAMTNLTVLSMANNRIFGPIPPEFGAMTDLTDFGFQNNRLDGPLPSELGDLTQLQILRLDANKIVGEVPGSLMNLMNLIPAGTSFTFNGLYTSDPALDAFLDAASGQDWSVTQTIAPVNLHKTDATDNCITMEWDVVDYTAAPGNYSVTYSSTPGGPYDPMFTITDDKFDNQHVECSLDPGETYYFIVRTTTIAHAANQNIVTSDWSPEVAMDTTGLPAGVLIRESFEDQN
jgi:hypothetical protein